MLAEARKPTLSMGGSITWAGAFITLCFLAEDAPASMLTCHDGLYPQIVNQNEPLFPQVTLVASCQSSGKNKWHSNTALNGSVLMASSSSKALLGGGAHMQFIRSKVTESSSREACLQRRPRWPAFSQPSSDHVSGLRDSNLRWYSVSPGKPKLPCEQCWMLSWLWGGLLHTNSSLTPPYVTFLPWPDLLSWTNLIIL